MNTIRTIKIHPYLDTEKETKETKATFKRKKIIKKDMAKTNKQKTNYLQNTI